MESQHMNTRIASLAIVAAAGLAACGPSKEHAHADSVAAAAASEQSGLLGLDPATQRRGGGEGTDRERRDRGGRWRWRLG